MRKLILSMMLTADGMTARTDGDLGWFRTDPDFEVEMLALLNRVDGMLFGRKSYLLLADYWPNAAAPGAPDAPGGFSTRERAFAFTRLMNATPKLVVSRTLETLAWGPSQLIRGDLAAALRRLKALPGRDLVVFAGATLARSCIELDLVDEYRLMLHPLLLGRGLGLFTGLPEERPLHLLESKSFSSGVVLVRYEPEQDASQRDASQRDATERS